MREPVITIVGSINMDLVVSAPRRPLAGETIMGEGFQTIPGGKGANQAVAAARLGAEVHMIGRVGDDDFGVSLMNVLSNEGINLDSVEPVTQSPSGIAVITLAEQDNSIVFVSGANQYVTPDYVRKFEERIANSDIVLTQLEIPIESVLETARLCHQHETTFILNPAPAQKLTDEIVTLADYLTPNQIELDELKKHHGAALQKTPQKLIVTEGSKGVAYHDGQEVCRVPSFSVQMEDTTGAGDTFNAAFAYAISKNREVHEVCQFANAAAALSVQKMGAQAGMPTKEEVISFLSQRSIPLMKKFEV